MNREAQQPGAANNSPLAGLRILVTRDESQAGQLTQKLKEKGAKPLELSVIQISEPATWQELDTALGALSEYDWIIFASSNAVNFTLQRATTIGSIDLNSTGIKVAAIGSATETRLKELGVKVDFVPQKFVGEDFVQQFGAQQEVKGKRFLLPRTPIGGTVIHDGLIELGGTVEMVEAYSTQIPSDCDLKARQLAHMVDDGNIAAITFASSQTVRNFVTIMQQSSKTFDQLRQTAVATIGPKTSQTARQLLGRVDIEAKVQTMDGLVESLMQYFSTRRESDNNKDSGSRE